MRHPTFRRLLALLVLLALLPAAALAHSGRTDSRGGHRDNKNKSGLGSYHFHCGGFPAHLHPNGVCPYSASGSSAGGKSSSLENVDELIRSSVRQGIVSPSLDLDTQAYCVAITSGRATKAVNVRQKPDTRSKKLGQCSKGDELMIVEPSLEPEFHQVIYQGKIGYVHTDYCELTDNVIKVIELDDIE